jgi:hypothetical protein
MKNLKVIADADDTLFINETYLKQEQKFCALMIIYRNKEFHNSSSK